jgi:heme/copper-type cytochrome/quinol oxidase subunit 2
VWCGAQLKKQRDNSTRTFPFAFFIVCAFCLVCVLPLVFVVECRCSLDAGGDSFGGGRIIVIITVIIPIIAFSLGASSVCGF